MLSPLHRAAWTWLLPCLAIATGCSNRDSSNATATFVREIPWAEQGVWLKADTHIHTKFSDGGVDLQEIVRRGRANGCDVLAITDHGDANLSATSDAYFDALDAARREEPELILLAGLEWNVPPWNGREHACVLVPPGRLERPALREFQGLFDDWNRSDSDPDVGLQALRWLAGRYADEPVMPVVIYNHPGRKRDSTDEFAAELGRWLESSQIALGFEGGPGHQDAEPIGAYQASLPAIDRWDPAVATVGGAWDKLLGQGLPSWGAIATSDFHNGDEQVRDDYWPGEFSETWLYAPDRTAAGAMAALRAGSFFAAHGHIAREVQLRVWSAGLERLAIAGEAIHVPPNNTVDVTLTMEVPLQDWEERVNLIDEVELIAVTPEKAWVMAKERPRLVGNALALSLVMPSSDLTLRARGRRIVENGPDLLFYTNPIQLLSTSGQTVVRSASAGAATAPTPRALARAEDRKAPAWLVLAFVTGGGAMLTLVVQWQVEIRRRFARDQQPPVPVHSTPLPVKRHLLAGLLVFVALAVYGSWVPLVTADIDWPAAMARFHSLLRQPLSFESRTDWTTNVVLFVPIGYLATGLLQGRAPSDRRRAFTLPIVVAACAVLSLVIEFGQVWIVDRTSSQNDIVAESLGGLIGGIGWLLSGRYIVGWLDRIRDAQRPREQFERALELFLLLLLAYLIIPLDLTLRPAELWHKFQEGRVNFVPFADFAATTEALVQLLSEALLFVPLGMLVALWHWPRRETVRPLGPSILFGAMVVGGVEAAQLLVYSRYSSTTDLLLGLIGVAAGWGIARWRLGSSSERSSLHRDPSREASDRLLAALSILATTACLLIVFCLPYEQMLSNVEASQRLRDSLVRAPMTALYWGTPLHAFTVVVRKLLLFSMFGSVLALMQPARRSRQPWKLGYWMIVLGLPLGIELLQLWLPPHVPDITDVALGTVGIAIGFVLTNRAR